jgi:hypothetical protein
MLKIKLTKKRTIKNEAAKAKNKKARRSDLSIKKYLGCKYINFYLLKVNRYNILKKVIQIFGIVINFN